MMVVFGGADPNFNYLDDINILNLEGLVYPSKLSTLATTVIIKNSKTLSQDKGFETLPLDIKNYINNQIAFLRLKKKQNSDVKTKKKEKIDYSITEDNDSIQREPSSEISIIDDDIGLLDSDSSSEEVTFIKPKSWFCCCSKTDDSY